MRGPASKLHPLICLHLFIWIFFSHGAHAANAPTSRPANIDAATWEKMLKIDARAARVTDLSADFEQRKFTAMLKKPLVSRGRVFVRGSKMLWETLEPEKTSLQTSDRDVRIYYPADKTVEIYAIEQKLGQLAASPLPRLGVLMEYFTFEPMAAAELEADAGEKKSETFAVRMTPTDAEMRKHIEQVRVLLDVEQGLILLMEMRDPDGDRTIIRFAHPVINSGLKEADVEAKLPADVKVTRPLAAVEAGASQSGDTGSAKDSHK